MFFFKKKAQKEEPVTEDKVKLEKGDIPAMFIAAAVVWGPFFLIFILALLIMGWVFGAF